jgi:hypothetical protein
LALVVRVGQTLKEPTGGIRLFIRLLLLVVVVVVSETSQQTLVVLVAAVTISLVRLELLARVMRAVLVRAIRSTPLVAVAALEQ